MLTKLEDVQDQIQKAWAPILTARFREVSILPMLLNRDYDGQIANEGDTVYVSQIVDQDGETKSTADGNADTFSAKKAQTLRISIIANKRAVIAYKFADLTQLQSQVQSPKFQDTMAYALRKELNKACYALVNPSVSSPVHDLTGKTNLDSDLLADLNVLASEALWPEDDAWYGLISPQYWGTILKDDDLKSSNFVSDQPVMNGQSARSLMGFNLYKDNSRQGKTALFFHRDFAHLAMQEEVRFKISDLHPLGQFGFQLSADIVFGTALGIEGSVKHIRVAP